MGRTQRRAWKAIVLGGLVLVLALVGRRVLLQRSARAAALATERLTRGAYLYQHVCHCDSCHARRDFEWFGAPRLGPSGAGFGTEKKFPAGMWYKGLPQRLYPRNLTSDPQAGLGRWTDAEIGRAIREGVSKDGSRLHPLMPYRLYRIMSDEDLAALIAHLRTLPPSPIAIPRAEIPEAILLALPPSPPEPRSRIDRADRVARGEYLAHLGECVWCHTEGEDGPSAASEAPLRRDRLFAGGRTWSWSDGTTVVSRNLTPDPDTGMRMDEDQFVAYFQSYRSLASGERRFRIEEVTTVMPWLHLSGLAEEDLRAIHAYLRSLPPVRVPLAGAETRP